LAVGEAKAPLARAGMSKAASRWETGDARLGMLQLWYGPLHYISRIPLIQCLVSGAVFHAFLVFLEVLGFSAFCWSSSLVVESLPDGLLVFFQGRQR
jgi:hypothetical protein